MYTWVLEVVYPSAALLHLRQFNDEEVLRYKQLTAEKRNRSDAFGNGKVLCVTVTISDLFPGRHAGVIYRAETGKTRILT
jgi:hypothetical protein